uniref:Serine/threonine-protein kinase ULK3 n=1 Tax=Echeneis naucrates TaxID=173247 RepID=A0A665VUL5_ECHNA
MASGSSFAPPKLADFILTERLGSGTYATVYKAYRKGSNREVVAVKVVGKKTLNKASTENLLTEIEILKTVRHPHIVHLKDFQWDAENIYLIMEWCSGGDLSRFIRSRRILPEKVAQRFLQQIACALQFLNERNISHLDLKPQNILLSGSDLKLADFGFAQYMSPWDEQSVLRGSPLYMAPEMVCRRQYDSRVDLWSVGVILYEALFGRAPFASRSYAELEEKIRSSQPIELPPGARVTKNCRDLLLRLLERNPDARITFAEFFTHPFVDLEHMPSADSLVKAKELVLQAIQKDQEGERSAALTLYCSALEHFVPAIHCKSNNQSHILSVVSQYVSRAEELKALVASDNRLSFEEARTSRDVLRGKANRSVRRQDCCMQALGVFMVRWEMIWNNGVLVNFPSVKLFFSNKSSMTFSVSFPFLQRSGSAAEWLPFSLLGIWCFSPLPCCPKINMKKSLRFKVCQAGHTGVETYFSGRQIAKHCLFSRRMH